MIIVAPSLIQFSTKAALVLFERDEENQVQNSLVQCFRVIHLLLIKSSYLKLFMSLNRDL